MALGRMVGRDGWNGMLGSNCHRAEEEKSAASSRPMFPPFLLRQWYSRKQIMQKITLISPFLIGFLLIQGCASHDELGKVDSNCPAPSKEQLNESGYLILQNGVTLKCQVKNYTNRMSCFGITDGTDDGWVCNNGKKNIVFVFDENGILKTRKTY